MDTAKNVGCNTHKIPDKKFKLEPTPTDASAAFLVISNRRSILLADLHQRSLERVQVAFENVVATASDMVNGTLFWSDMKLKTIFKLEKGEKPVKVSFDVFVLQQLIMLISLLLSQIHALCVQSVYL